MGENSASSLGILRQNMLEAFKDAEHAQSLRALGLWSDVEYAALQDESK